MRKPRSQASAPKLYNGTDSAASRIRSTAAQTDSRVDLMLQPRNQSRHCQQHELLGLRGDQHSLVGSSLAGFSPCWMHASSPHCHHATVRHSSPAYRLQILAPDEVVKLFVSGCIPERPQSVLEDSPLQRNSSNRSAFSEPVAPATTSPVQN
ncbi:unnamed protein product [Sphagnum balticum]